ncbi:hypothetical protein P2318_26840 [Myxococcaceae bacterium GXIMD 01537]
MRLPATPLLLMALLALGACNRPRFDTPVDAYSSFHRLVQRGELKQAYAVLSQPTRDVLNDRAQKVSQASGGAVKPEPISLFFANVLPPSDVTGVTLLREEGDVATVRVFSSGQSSEVRMVKEPSGWKVDLTASLQP